MSDNWQMGLNKKKNKSLDNESKPISLKICVHKVVVDQKNKRVQIFSTDGARYDIREDRFIESFKSVERYLNNIGKVYYATDRYLVGQQIVISYYDNFPYNNAFTFSHADQYEAKKKARNEMFKHRSSLNWRCKQESNIYLA